MSLLDKASLIVTPNAYKESKLYSVVPSSGAGDMDVVRATTATRVNSAGLIEVVPRNLVTYSEEFDNVFWTKVDSTITANSTTAPNGLIVADSLLDNATNNIHALTPSITKAATPITYTSTIYAKFKDANKKLALSLDDAITGGVDSGVFNLSTGAWDTALPTPSAGFTNASRNFENVGNGWYRLSLTVTSNSGTTIRPNVLLANSSNAFVYVGNGTGIFIFGAQLEAFSTATEYFPTTTRLNIPRIDYTNGSCPSLLVEPQRTNLQGYSNDFNLWTLSNTTVTANNGISPDGTQNADRVQFTTGGLMYYGSNGSAGSNTLSVYAKAKNGVSAKFRFFANGATLFSSNQTATGTWQRFTFTYTYTALTVGLAIATTGADDILFYGFQHEIGSYPTSYIPTLGASSVTRNADVISKTGISSLIGQTEGTLFADFTINNLLIPTNENRSILNVTNGTANFVGIIFSNINVLRAIIRANNGTIYTISTDVIPIGRYKLAVTYKNAELKLYVNGFLIGTNTSASISWSSALDRLNLDNSILGGESLTEKINFVANFKTVLTQTECINLTTL